MDQPRPTHLHAVPPARGDETRVGSREPATPQAGAVEALDQVQAQVAQARAGGGLRGLGEGQLDEGMGTIAGVGSHALTTTGAAGVGALVGGLASGTWTGAGLGALAHLSLLGLTASLFGSGRLTTTTRMIYAVLALVAGAGAGWLVWRRMR